MYFLALDAEDRSPPAPHPSHTFSLDMVPLPHPVHGDVPPPRASLILCLPHMRPSQFLPQSSTEPRRSQAHLLYCRGIAYI